mgnify:CR=1 FL=1
MEWKNRKVTSMPELSSSIVFCFKPYFPCIMKKEITYSLLFIVIVLLISWCYTGFIFSTPDRIKFFVFIMFIPGSVALTLNTIRYKSLKEVFRPIISPIKIKSLLFSFLYPLLFIVLLAVIVLVTDMGTLNASKLKDLTKYPPLITFLVGFLLIFGEEYGWRGFLLKNLAEAKGKIVASLIVGAVWALWHGPLIYGLAYNMHMENPFLVMLIQMGAVFVCSIPFTYSYFLTNNIVAPMLFHFTWNFYNPLILGNIYRNQPGIIDGNLMVINGEGLGGLLLGLLFMIWFLKQFKKEEKELISPL